MINNHMNAHDHDPGVNMNWEESLEGYEDLILVNAHCDQRILHFVGLCQWCDMYPEAQAKRVELGVNFTSCHDPDLLPCPADRARDTVGMMTWGGNQPKGPGVPEDKRPRRPRRA